MVTPNNRNKPSPRTLAKQAKIALYYPTQTRHYDPARHIACLAAGVNYARRTVSAAADITHAEHDRYSKALPETWDVEELSAVLPPQLKADNRPIFPGQTKANGNPLPPPLY